MGATLTRLGLAAILAVGLTVADLSPEEFDVQQRKQAEEASAALGRDFAPSRFDQLAEDMRFCSDHAFESPEITTEAFFAEFFGQRWVHMPDSPEGFLEGPGQRGRRCAGVFQRELVRPLLGAATQEYIGKHVNLVAPSATATAGAPAPPGHWEREQHRQKCRSRSQCKAAFDRGDSTVVIGAVEHFRPAASLLVRSPAHIRPFPVIFDQVNPQLR